MSKKSMVKKTALLAALSTYIFTGNAFAQQMPKDADAYIVRARAVTKYSAEGRNDSTVFERRPILSAHAALRENANVFGGAKGAVSDTVQIENIRPGAGKATPLGTCTSVPTQIEQGTRLEWQTGQKSYKLDVDSVLSTVMNGKTLVRVLGKLETIMQVGSIVEEGRAYVIAVNAASGTAEISQAEKFWFEKASSWILSTYFISNVATTGDIVAEMNALNDSIYARGGVKFNFVTTKKPKPGVNAWLVTIASAYGEGKLISDPSNNFAVAVSASGDEMKNGAVGTASLSVPYQLVYLGTDGKSEGKYAVVSLGDTAAMKAVSTTLVGPQTTPNSISVSAYPNPSVKNNGIRIRASLPGGDRAVLRVFDIMGRQVAKFDMDGGGERDFEFTPASDFPPGAYIMRIDAGGKTGSAKFNVLGR